MRLADIIPNKVNQLCDQNINRAELLERLQKRRQAELKQKQAAPAPSRGPGR